MKNRKKGFTIVELVIVIAVIGILAGILIPTFANLINDAKIANDTSAVRNINLQLSSAEVNGKNQTMYDALLDAKDAGYIVENINAKSKDNIIVWNQKTDRVALIDKEGKVLAGEIGKDVKDWELWVISDTVSTQYSTYYIGSQTTINTNKGFDCGNVEGIEEINYTNTNENQNVVIRTNGGVLNVGTNEAVAKGTITHYGSLNKTVVYTEDNSFHTHGTIAKMELKAGKAVAKTGGYVALIEAAENTEAVENGGIFYIPTGTEASAINLTLENLTTLGYDVVEDVVTVKANVDKTYKIGSKAELVEFRNAWNIGAVNCNEIKLTANIDIAGENWTPIGNWGHPFNGTFDGNGKTISGLTAVGTLGSDGVYNIGGTIGFGECYGFIGIVGEGNTEVKDLTFTNVNINLVNGTNVGAVIGYAPALNKGYEGDKIDSVGTLTLSGVTASGEINAKKHVGGLVGDSRTAGDVTFTNCVNNINITSTHGGQTGGIIGCINTCSVLTMNSCKNNGNIVVTGTGGQGVAGLVGRASGASLSVTITDCESNGNILSTENISGVIDVEGQALSSLSISNTKVTGLVVTTGAYDAYVLHGNPSGSPTITHSGNIFTGIVEANKGADTTGKNAKLNNVVAPDGYAIASIYKVIEWGDPTIYHDANGDLYYYNNPTGIHQVGYVVYDTNGEWTQIEGKNIEYMAVGEGYYVFRVNGSDIYARYTENPTTDYRTLSQHPNHGQYVVA